MIEKKFVLIGGGIGSFCFYNCLRIHGINKEDIAVISPNKKPYQTLKSHCDNLGLTKNERLRSDSGSRPDNLWGFPGYGLSEIIEDARGKRFFSAAKLAIMLFFEPIFFGYYSPKTEQVYKAIDRESKRTGYERCLIKGIATLIKIDGDSYIVSYKNINGKKEEIKSNYIHLALGHGKHSKSKRFYSPYDNNKELFNRIKKDGGTVLVIGRGTAAAKIVEKVLNLKSKKKIEVVSYHRNILDTQTDYRKAKRGTLISWRLQQFNWPRSAFGGNILDIVQDNGESYWTNLWGAPSTTPNKIWIKLIKNSLRSGKYRIVYKREKADYTFDCTGFSKASKNNKLYKKLLKKYNLKLNSESEIKVGRNFEVEELCGYRSRIFISGTGAQGNYYGPVDSFLGLQYSALKCMQAIPEVKPLSIEGSLGGWYKLVRNKKI